MLHEGVLRSLLGVHFSAEGDTGHHICGVAAVGPTGEGTICVQEGGGHWPPHPPPPGVHDSTIYLLKAGLQQTWSGVVGEEPSPLPRWGEILGGRQQNSRGVCV